MADPESEHPEPYKLTDHGALVDRTLAAAGWNPERIAETLRGYEPEPGNKAGPGMRRRIGKPGQSKRK
jgi:hypothetical protein